jgi:O-antigen/teichoic acid export membrane protein
MPLLGVAILLWLLSTVLEVVAVADNDIRSASVFIVVIQLTKSALMMLAAVLFGSVHAVVMAAVIQGVLQCLIMFSYLHKRFGRFWSGFDWALFKAQLANALPFGIGGLAYGMQADLHNYFVSHYFDPDQFAIYSIGTFQLPLLGLLFDSVISVLLPEVARREATADYQGIIELWSAAIRKLAFFFLPTYALLFVVRHEFISVLFTQTYVSAAPIFAINLLSVLLWVCVPTAILRSFDELRYFRLKLSLVVVPVLCVALYVGIHAAGLVGAITAFVVIQTLDLGILVLVIARRLRMSLEDIWRLAPVLRTISAVMVAGIATYALRLGLTGWHSFITLAVCSLVFVVVFLLGAFVTGAVTAAERNEMSGTVVRFYRAGSRRLGFAVQADIEEQRVA